MNGLELSEKYYWAFGAPLIAQKFGDCKDRIAAGLVGDGSECYGFDDEISRDHDWGPAFCLWLDQGDYRAVGARLEEELAGIPGDFEGFGPRMVSEWGRGRVGVFEIGQFYKKFIGFDRVPASVREWRAIPENNLAAATNGKVFVDPSGGFTDFRNRLLGFYPEDVRLKKIAARCMTLGQLGQYNFARCAQRQEAVAARYIEGQFSAQAISMVFLLNRRYAPFYKWMHRAVRALPILGEITNKLLLDIANSYGYGKKITLLEQVCANIVEELRRQSLTDASGDFLLDHGRSVQEKIQDPELRSIDVWLE
ncbi:MAG: DUF4037 domain-containing protein [Chloroflexi bacterium]|nr:DUF4037 domain-containing protein [Chloroflexota bacterium]